MQEAVAAQAERMVAGGLKRLGWTETDLKARRKGDPGKVRLARELRSQTTMPLGRIAERLRMGSRGYLAWLLRRRANPRPGQSSNQGLREI